MLIPALSLLGGLVLLVFAADWLVEGAVGIARRFGVPMVVVGLTVVAYGTSFPELVVSVLAGARGVSDFAIGNVVGSNIANIGLVLGATALVRPFTVASRLLYRRDMPILAFTTALTVGFLVSGELSRLHGIVLLAIAVGFTVACLRMRSEGEAETHAEALPPVGRSTVRVVLGVLGLVGGAHFMIEGGSEIALQLGISERVVGLTVVAVGTSLPELAASVAGALKGYPALAVGNVVGSCLFNLAFVLGATGTFSPISVSAESMIWDCAVMGALTALMWMMLVTGRRMSRGEGITLVATYVAYLTYLTVTTVNAAA